MLEVPEDFKAPEYARLKGEIIGLLHGALSSVALTEEGALRKIRQACGTEWGYSDEFVKSIPEWKARFPKAAAQAPLPQVVVPTGTPATQPITESPKAQTPTDSDSNKQTTPPVVENPYKSTQTK